jgi:predicted DNA-binding protein (MmcQ/YjbR family)
VSPDAFKAACLALPGTHLIVQWGGSSVYKVGPKVFAIAGLERAGEPQTYVFKVSEMAYELLIEHGAARSAPYLGRAKWVQLVDQDALGDDDLRAYLSQAHALIAAKLTRAQRKDLGLIGP